ncbi:MAG: hypothetical protein LW724_20055 [Planctomycetaceae bacterium]|jgi:hypothetical protein|nr:hypothetical protein [Planctomycetaceae bacterium]
MIRVAFSSLILCIALSGRSQGDSGFEWPDEIKSALQNHKRRMANGEFYFSFDAAEQPRVDGRLECNDGRYRIQFQYPDSPEIVLVSRNEASFRLIKDMSTKVWKPSLLARQPYERLTVFPDLHFSFAFNGTDFLSLPAGNLDLFDGEYSPNGDAYVVSWRVVDETQTGPSGKFAFRKKYGWGCVEVRQNLSTGGTMISSSEYEVESNAATPPLLTKVVTESNGQRETTMVLRQVEPNPADPDRFSLEHFGLSEDLLGVKSKRSWDFPWYLVFIFVGISLLGVRFLINRSSR